MHKTNSDPNQLNQKISDRPLGLMNLMTVGLISIGLSVLLIGAYDHYRYRPIITVDVERIMQTKLDAEQKRIMNSPAGSIDNQAMVRMSKQWATQLSNEVSRITREYNAIVLVRPAVVEGGIDMTGQVMNALQ